MSRSLFVLSDGTEIFSGGGQVPAIKSVTYTSTAVTAADLDYAAACTASLDGTLIDTSGVFTVVAGDSFDYYEVDNPGTEDENRVLIGRFIFEKPTKPSANTYKFKAYDRMTLFDRDITEWLTNLPDWPYTIRQMLELVCDECGVTLSDEVQLVNGEYAVSRFLQQATARDLVRWIAAANAAFAFITPAGDLSFFRFDFENPVVLAQDIKKLSASDFETAPISGVVVRQEEDDVGVSWPANSSGEMYVVLGNPLLATFSTEDLEPFVEALSNHLLNVSYTPAEVQIYSESATLPCCSGGVIQVQDRNGRTYTTPIFNLKRTGGLITAKSTGNRSRASTTAVAGKNAVEIIQGRVARMKVSIEEVSAELSQQRATVNTLETETAGVKVTVSEIQSRVENVKKTADNAETMATEVKQTAQGLSVTISQIDSKLSDEGVYETVSDVKENFAFGADGMTISNSATGMGINVSEKQVAFIGGADPTTVITPSEMQTTNLKVGERQGIGDFVYLPRQNGNLSFRYIGG